MCSRGIRTRDSRSFGRDSVVFVNRRDAETISNFEVFALRNVEEFDKAYKLSGIFASDS